MVTSGTRQEVPEGLGPISVELRIIKLALLLVRNACSSVIVLTFSWAFHFSALSLCPVWNKLLPTYLIKGLEEILGVTCTPLGTIRAQVGSAVCVNSVLKIVQRVTWVQEPVGRQSKWWAWMLSFLKTGKCKWQTFVMICSVLSHAHWISNSLV